jgi:hypothetical protein
MARLKNGFLGNASGKLGNVVFAKWRDLFTVRSYQPDISDAKTRHSVHSVIGCWHYSSSSDQLINHSSACSMKIFVLNQPLGKGNQRQHAGNDSGMLLFP